MYRPSMRKNWTIISITVLSLIIYLIIEGTTYIEKSPHYDEKINAAELTKNAFDIIKNHRFKYKVNVDDINDPLHTYLIGQQYTRITTDRGVLNSKLISLNPNFAAVLVEMMKGAKLEKGDKVAVAFTGSFPALNIAVYAAATSLGLDILPISSVGASMWGATDPEFTWLDIESLLLKKSVFAYKSIAASMGGNSDNGMGLSPAGRDLIISAINRNEVHFINNQTLLENINERVNIFEKESKENIKCYINVGGGLGSLGSAINGKLINAGLIQNIPQENFPTYGALIHYAMKGVPIIHLLRIHKLANEYGLETNIDNGYIIGEGSIFYEEKYNLTLTLILAFVLFIFFGVVLYFDQKSIKLDKEGFHPEELL